MQLVAAPAFRLALAVLFAAPVAELRQFGEVLVEVAIKLAVQTLLALVRRFRCRGLSLFFRLRGGLFPRLDLGAVATDVAGDLASASLRRFRFAQVSP